MQTKHSKAKRLWALSYLDQKRTPEDPFQVYLKVEQSVKWYSVASVEDARSSITNCLGYFRHFNPSSYMHV